MVLLSLFESVNSYMSIAHPTLVSCQVIDVTFRNQHLPLSLWVELVQTCLPKPVALLWVHHTCLSVYLWTWFFLLLVAFVYFLTLSTKKTWRTTFTNLHHVTCMMRFVATILNLQLYSPCLNSIQVLGCYFNSGRTNSWLNIINHYVLYR